MRKRTITALMLSAALVLAPVSGELAMTVHAAENGAVSTGAEASKEAVPAPASVSGSDAGGSGSTETTGKTQLATPTGVQWGETGIATWNSMENTEGYYYLGLYRDGKQITGWSVRENNELPSKDFRSYFDESGAYQFRVRSRAAYDPDHYTDSEWSELSAAYNYVRPDKVLGSTACYWSDTKPGTICWQPVEGAGGYQVTMYLEDNGTPGWQRVWNIHYNPNRTSCDFTSSIEIRGAGRYYCTVRALSGDIETIANGVEGAPSEYYDTTAAADTISGIISGAVEGAAPAEALETIKAEIDRTALRTAMQTDNTVLNQIKDLESAYAAEQGITVSAPAVSEEAGAYVKADEISVVGAGLNAAAGQMVGLEVSVPDKKEYVPSQHYANSVQLDIRLKRGEESVHELEIPVTITLPIPRGLDARRLVILHYSEDGSFETVNARNNGDGTVTFTVSRFSTFAFAEQNEDSGEADDDQSDSAESDTDDGSSVSEYVVTDVDWNAAGSSLDAAAKTGNGQNVDVMTGTRFTVPASVTGKLAGKRVTLALQTGSGLAFSISGTNVKAAKELKMTVTYGESIPEAVRQQVTAGAAFSRMFAMEEKGNYPFRLNVHVSVGRENAGKQVYLYYYDEASGRMRLSGTFTVTENGQAMFGISRGDEYIVVVGQKGSTGGSYRVVTGDTLSGIAAGNGIGLQKLLSLNPQIKDKNKIYPGQIINIQ